MSLHTRLPLLPAILAAILLGVLAPAGAAEEEGGPIILRAGRTSVRLGRAEKGAILSFTDTPTGVEFAAAQASPRLFSLTFSPKGEPAGERLSIGSEGAGRFRAAVIEAGGVRTATLEYADFAGRPIRVTCTARASERDPLIRWRLRADFPDNLVLEEVVFPIVVARAPLSAEAAGDAFVAGNTKGGITRRPADLKPGAQVRYRQPGNLAAQFACYYDDRAGLTLAAYDGKGTPKDVCARRTGEGLELSWNPHCFAQGRYETDFDLVQSTFSGANTPADWRDAADIYKEWALTQPWCAQTYAARKDIPAWMKAGPAMIRFNRAWLASPERIEQWLATYWERRFPRAPLITAYWGWEKHESWVTPDYFPLYPSDEQFRALVARNRKRGYHAFPWPSGYHWTLTFAKQADGTFTWDDRERFDRIERAHAIHDRKGEFYHSARSWLQGGETSCLCPGDPWTLRWWNEDVCRPLAQRGCEMIQVDQVVGGGFPYCYHVGHGHPPGPGPWMSEVFARQLRGMYETCRAVERDAVIGVEEPNELFNHLVGIQDYRDIEPAGEWASVFNYLYHEYLPTFQSNPRAGDVPMLAWCFANGMIPHWVPHWPPRPEPAPANGNFEDATGKPASGWDKVGGYQGKVWNGKAFRDDVEKHGGAASLRLENEGEETVQVSQNVMVGRPLVIGRTYRLSAWMKTERLDRPNAINCGTLTTDVKSTGAGGRLPFPTAGAGWARAACDFTVPEGSSFLRIMIHVEGPAKVWVDDVQLEEVQATGTVPAMMAGEPLEHPLLENWVSLFHGEGRPYLLLGRMLHPPKLDAGTISYRGRPFPALLHNAYRAPDGSEAVIVVNASDTTQTGRLTWKGRTVEIRLEKGGARLWR